jgi:hypothetical protein
MAKQGLQQVFDSSVIERTALMNEMNAMSRIGGYQQSDDSFNNFSKVKIKSPQIFNGNND